MKQNFLKPIYAIAVLAIIMLTNSCKKDDDTAYQPAGNYVTTGTNNNTVKNYDFTLHSWDWSWDNLYRQWYYNQYVNEDFQSAIYGYVMSGNGEEAMPYYNQVNFTTTSFANDLFQSTPYIKFEYYDGSTTLSSPSSDTYLYLVIIPPSQRLSDPNINYSDYNSVKKAYHLGNPTHLEK